MASPRPMPRLACPRCATQIDAVPGAIATCPRCGFAAPTPGAPGAPAPVTWPPPPGTTYAQYAPPGYAPTVRTSPLAVAGMVVGILSVFPFYALGLIFGTVGVVLSAVGLRQINANPAGLKGKGFAIAGIATGIAGIVLGTLMLFVFIGIFSELASSSGDGGSYCDMYPEDC